MAVGGVDRIDLTLRQANDAVATEMDLAAGAANNVALATIIAAIPAGPNVTVSHRHEGLGTGVTRYYWLRARDGLENASAWSVVASATTT